MIEVNQIDGEQERLLFIKHARLNLFLWTDRESFDWTFQEVRLTTAIDDQGERQISRDKLTMGKIFSMLKGNITG